jgi:hypothetical protein
MIYYAPGGTHAPHHPTPEWIKKISDMHLFDKGYNDLREQIVANQKRLGIIPQNAQLTAWPDSIPNWEMLSPDAKKLFIRQAGVQVALLFLFFHKRLCGPLANSRFHHEPDAKHRPHSQLEAAYHRADKAINQIVGLLAAA